MAQIKLVGEGYFEEALQFSSIGTILKFNEHSPLHGIIELHTKTKQIKQDRQIRDDSICTFIENFQV